MVKFQIEKRDDAERSANLLEEMCRETEEVQKKLTMLQERHQELLKKAEEKEERMAKEVGQWLSRSKDGFFPKWSLSLSQCMGYSQPVAAGIRPNS